MSTHQDLIQEILELPNPKTSLLSHNERELIEFCYRLGCALQGKEPVGTKAALAAPQDYPPATPLNVAFTAISALGGYTDPDDHDGQIRAKLLDQVVEILEKHGGQDTRTRVAAAPTKQEVFEEADRDLDDQVMPGGFN